MTRSMRLLAAASAAALALTACGGGDDTADPGRDHAVRDHRRRDRDHPGRRREHLGARRRRRPDPGRRDHLDQRGAVQLRRPVRRRLRGLPRLRHRRHGRRRTVARSRSPTRTRPPTRPQATQIVTDLIGQGVKIIAGTVVSGVALQVAPLAEQNDILYISGPAATDGITGINSNTFRSGRQSYQDILTAQQIIGDVDGKKVTVFAQDTAFGQANVAAVEAVMGGAGRDRRLDPRPRRDQRLHAVRPAGQGRRRRPAVRRLGRRDRRCHVGVARPAGRARRRPPSPPASTSGPRTRPSVRPRPASTSCRTTSPRPRTTRSTTT